MIAADLVALALNRPGRWVVGLRVVFFLPVVSAWVAVALIWKWLLNPRFGLFNYLLGLVGVTGPDWLFDPQWAMPAIILTSVWKDIGFVMVMFLAGLQNIPVNIMKQPAWMASPVGNGCDISPCRCSHLRPFYIGDLIDQFVSGL